MEQKGTRGNRGGQRVTWRTRGNKRKREQEVTWGTTGNRRNKGEQGNKG